MPNRKESWDANNSMTVDETSLVFCVRVCVYIQHQVFTLNTRAKDRQKISRPLLCSYTILTLPRLTKPLPLKNILLLSDFRRVQRLSNTGNTQQSLYSHPITRASVDIVFALISVVLFYFYGEATVFTLLFCL